MVKRIIPSILKYVLQGALYITPVAVTSYVVYKAFVLLDELIPFDFPGLGFIVLIVLLTLVGYVGSAFISSPFSRFFKQLLNQAPLLHTIYTAVQDLMKTVVGEKQGFSQPVLVQLYENSSLKRIGFITNEALGNLGLNDDHVLVYLPHSYAFSGQLFVVERSFVTPVERASSEIMKLIVSGGITEVDSPSPTK